MPHVEIKPLPIAVRVYPQPENVEPVLRSRKPWSVPEAMLVFDTETRVDATQRLTFGSYRFIVAGQCLEEGLFYGDDLPEKDRQVLENYAARFPAETAQGGVRQLHLLTLRRFLEKFYRAVYKGRCLLVGFNLPFDLSRIACDVTDARGRFAGGFSLGFWSRSDKRHSDRSNRFRPRIAIKQIDNKRALKGFTGRYNPDKADLIPEESTDGKPEKAYRFRGHFLDLRTLAFALTDKSYSLESACKAFGVEHGKQLVARHGTVTEKYIQYNRRDVLATWELAVKLLEEYAKHPITLQATKAYSPASIGKAYLRAMGIKPVLERQRRFSKEYLGHAASAFFGGRTSAHIRKVPVPVVYTDFLSMYPTVNGLMGLWRFVTAREIRVVKHCRNEIQAFLNRVKPADLVKPATWKRLTGFVQIIPDGDILPTRAKCGKETNDWQVAINHVYANMHDPKHALWFSLPDVVVSKLLTGRTPRIVDAFRIKRRGVLPGLETIKLRSAVSINPRRQDFFKVVIEERKRLPLRSDLSEIEKERLDKALKVLANAASYGIYAEMNRQESDSKVNVKCHGIDRKPFTCRVAHPDVPGEYCFPPFASLITGAARLMLSLLEHCVSARGGTYAMEDTDSMAIVATKRGGFISCPGGSYSLKDGRMGVKALSWKDVEQITERFAALNIYAQDAVLGSILKIEKDNRDPNTGRQRQPYCLPISAKRYALFLLDRNGTPALLQKDINNEDNQWSEHGLGHLLNPTDPESEDREWIAQIWQRIILKALDLPIEKLNFEERPAVGRITLSSPAVLRPLASLNKRKQYADQIKPFNFLLSCHVKALGHPIGTNPERFHLIGSYEVDSRKWLQRDWIDQYSRKRYHITTTDHHGSRGTARVKTYGDVATEYEFHPETKCADSDGKPCGKQTVGLLDRRHIRVDQIKYIGKESNSLEDVDQGLIHSAQNVYTEYPDPRRDEWETKVRPALKRVPLPVLHKKTGLSRRMLIKARTGRARPHLRNRKRLAAIVRKLGLI
jgi:hypothetical protein